MSPRNADNPDGFAAPPQFLHGNIEIQPQFGHGGSFQIASDSNIHKILLPFGASARSMKEYAGVEV